MVVVRPKTGVRLVLADLFRFPEVPERPRLALSLLLLLLLLLFVAVAVRGRLLCKEGEGNGPNAVEHDKPCAFLHLVSGGVRVTHFCFAGRCRGVEHIARPHDRARYGREDQLCNEKSDAPETPLRNK